MNYVIIGNSAAGIAAAEAIRQIDRDSSLTIISDEPEHTYSRALISYELAGWIDKGCLDLRPQEFYDDNHITRLLGQRAEKIDPAAQQVVLQNGNKIPYDKLLLATGGSPQKTGIAGEEKKGVFGFRTVADLMKIYDTVKNAQSGVVLGGGCVGLQAASGLHHHKVKTTIVIASPHLLSQVADPECGDFFQELFEKNGIKVRTGVSPVEFKGGDSIEKVVFDDGTELAAQIVIVGKGVKPNAQLAEGTGIKVDWGILTDDHLLTAEPDIYAAGDVAVTEDRVTCESTVNAVWPCAYEQGRVAGLNMAGKDARYDGSMRMNAADFFGISFISLGVVKPREDGYDMHTYYNKNKQLYRKLIFKNEKLVGAVLIGNVDNAGVLANLMRKQVDVSSIKQSLIDGQFDFGVIRPLIREQADHFQETEYKEAYL
ncbi:FAD-dependent oxidoreductase [bacterium]|nr:FAD-dependent oxidoreductase [bacterium]